MSKAGKGLIRGVRNLLEEWSSFGRPELQRLRREAAELKEEIEAIKEAREQLKLNQEAIVLAQLKGALRHMQDASQNLDQQRHLVQEVAEKLGEQAAAVQVAALEMKALRNTEELFETIDVGKYVREGASLEDCLLAGAEGKGEASSHEERLPEKG